MEKTGQAISIIGSKFIDTVVGNGLSQLDQRVIFFDVLDKDLPGFTKDVRQSIPDSNASIICVPTPTLSDGSVELRFLEHSIQSIACALKHKDLDQVIVSRTARILFPPRETGRADGDSAYCTIQES